MKLIRDKILDIMEKKGQKYEYYIAQKEELSKFAKEKLVEEAEEAKNTNNRNDLVEELGDLLEIIYYTASINGIDMNEVEKNRKNKKELKGGFEKGIILTKW